MKPIQPSLILPINPSWSSITVLGFLPYHDTASFHGKATCTDDAHSAPHLAVPGSWVNRSLPLYHPTKTGSRAFMIISGGSSTPPDLYQVFVLLPLSLPKHIVDTLNFLFPELSFLLVTC